MGTEIIIVPIFFGVIFGIVYLFVTARNKERLALIEKGADASIFYSNKKGSFWQVIIINLALLFMGIGAGIFFGGLLVQSGMEEEIAMPGTIFFMAGAGLLTGFYLTKKLASKE